MRCDAFSDLFSEFANAWPNWLIRIFWPQGEVKAGEFWVGISQGEGLLTGADFDGDSVKFVDENIAEPLCENEWEVVVLVFRRIFCTTD